MQTHLKFLINRLIFRAQTTDIFHGAVQKKFPLAFEMARVAGEELRRQFGYPLELSELSYLALYFELALHEHDQPPQKKKRQIAVVCTTGRGAANMIKHQLTRVLGHDIAITQYSEENFNPAVNDDYFAIFTTIPLKLERQLKTPVIRITKLFDDQWLQAEWQRVKHYHQKNLQTVCLKFVRLPQAAHYKDYLRHMAALLAKEGLVDDDFEQRILDREDKQSTIMGNGIAFPHTINQLATKTILLLGVLEEPYLSQEDKVKLIFLVAIPSKVEKQMESDLLELYDDIFQIAGDSRFKDALGKLQTESEFLALTREKEVF